MTHEESGLHASSVAACETVVIPLTYTYVCRANLGVAGLDAFVAA